MAAGGGRRYGGVKQLAPVGPGGESLLEYTVHDAAAAGFARAVLVIRRDLEASLRSRVMPLPVDYAYQDPEPGRAAPWGTGQAVLCAEASVSGPFGVVNADDHYGPDALAELSRALSGPATSPPEFFIVGYPLPATLGNSGGVSRAICHVDDEGYLVNLEEWTEVRREGKTIVGRSPSGSGALVGDEMVSMNLWGFTHAVFPDLRVAFESHRAISTPSEFRIGDAVMDMVRHSRARVRILTKGRRDWFGITHPADLEPVQRRIAESIANGAFPAALAPHSPRHEGHPCN